jgi:hypothetical protein
MRQPESEDNQMITLRRSTERQYVRNGAVKMWKTFDHANAADPFHRGFRTLEALNEVNPAPRTGFNLQAEKDREIVTYVREGGLLVRNRPEGD